MRFKILATSPELKAWFDFDSQDKKLTVSDIKSSLCSQLSPLKNANVKPSNITLTLDDFDLLDSSVASIVRDGDLVCLKHNGTPFSRKRKIEDLSSSSSSEDDDPESETSSSDSDSTSSDSDSDTSAAPSQQPIKPLTPIPRPIQKGANNTTLVPPGKGRPSTHSRNLRRRRKRQFDHGMTDESASHAISSTNDIPLGGSTINPQFSNILHVTAQSETSVMMASLRNKNKKKGFKNFLNNPLPEKIVFSALDALGEASTTLPSNHMPASEPSWATSESHSRLIPPSERDDLPSNIFVTSVDVEQDLHSKKRRAKEPACAYPEIDVTELTSNEEHPDFESIEKGWDSFPVLNNCSQVDFKCLVGWKALGINPATFTPEVLVNLARVVSSDTSNVVICPIPRTDSQTAFNAMVDVEETPENESHTWDEVIAAGWRLVQVAVL